MENKPEGTYELCHCSAARRAARVVSRLYDRHLAPTGLSISQFSLLATLAGRGSLSAAALAELMAMERTTLLRALKPLQLEGWVQSHREGPKGTLHLALSPKGTIKLEHCRPYWERAQMAREARLGVASAHELRQALLASLVPTLEDSDP